MRAPREDLESTPRRGTCMGRGQLEGGPRAPVPSLPRGTRRTRVGVGDAVAAWYSMISSF